MMMRFTPLLFTLLAAALLTACGDDKAAASAAPSAPPPLKVETINVVKESVPIWVQFTGTTKASSDQEVRARVSGRLEKIYFEDGQQVKAGDRLFQIEQSQYRASLDAAIAKKERDLASQRLAKADVDRYTPLVEEGLAPRATLEQYQARYGELKAEIMADEAEIANTRLQLSYTTVTAPISGRVSARRVDVGNLVGYGESTLLTTIMNIDPIYAYFSPSESDMQQITRFQSKQKLDAFIEVRGSGENILQRKRLDGYVDFADNTVDPYTSTISMRATIDNPEHSILPGTFVYVNVFMTDKIDLVMVPPQVVFEDQLGKYVYVDDHGTASRKNVKTGYASRFFTMIKEGLTENDAVVLTGLMKVKPGASLDATDVTATKGVRAIIEANGLIPNKE